jgi:hypothetical protein
MAMQIKTAKEGQKILAVWMTASFLLGIAIGLLFNRLDVTLDFLAIAVIDGAFVLYMTLWIEKEKTKMLKPK